MKKPLIALSIVCASALALADSAQYNEAWFSGIGQGATLEDMKASNGSWAIPAESASVESAALVLDLDSNEAATFTIGGVDGDSGETGTVQTLSVTGVFNPISAGDLLAGKKMNEKNAQVGFAVVGAESEGTMTYKYYAWVGAIDGATAAEDWAELSELGAVADPEASTALTIELNYWDANKMTATFKVGGKADTKPLTSTAATNKKIASVSCTGSGTLNALSGAYQYAVAKVVKDGVETKYPTYDKAIEAGATDTTLVGLKAAVGEVTKTVSDTTKEIGRDSEGKVVIQTAKWVLEGVKVGKVNEGAGKALAVNETLRTFLSKNCKGAYTKAGVKAEDIKNALDATDSATQRPLWQSYVLGLEPSDVLTLKPAAEDKVGDKITLALPIKPTGDFTVKCKVGNGEAQTLTAEDTSVAVPLATGHYAVTITLE